MSEENRNVNPNLLRNNIYGVAKVDVEEGKKGFFARLKAGLTKTRDNIVKGIDSVFSGYSNIDDDFYEELEEILIMGDMGVSATTQIIEYLKDQVKEQHLK